MHVQQTIQWIQSVVIDLNLCPFAQREMNNNSVRIEVSAAKIFIEGMNDFSKEIAFLNKNPTIGTSLLLFPDCGNDFCEYLDFVDLVNEELINNEYEGIYQLATFHPQYQFAGTVVDDVTNYTNRSPYPMLHILREEMLEKAIVYYGDTDIIPENNIRCMQKLGLDKMTHLLQNCLEQPVK